MFILTLAGLGGEVWPWQGGPLKGRLPPGEPAPGELRMESQRPGQEGLRGHLA